MSCVKLSINYDEVRFSLYVVFQMLQHIAETAFALPTNSAQYQIIRKTLFQRTIVLRSKENYKHNFFAVERLKTKANTENRICCVVKQQKCIVRNAKCLRNNVPT